jgi:hypothetical protein
LEIIKKASSKRPEELVPSVLKKVLDGEGWAQ